jgi:hypothetical protein
VKMADRLGKVNINNNYSNKCGLGKIFDDKIS